MHESMSILYNKGASIFQYFFLFIKFHLVRPFGFARAITKSQVREVEKLIWDYVEKGNAQLVDVNERQQCLLRKVKAKERRVNPSS